MPDTVKAPQGSLPVPEGTRRLETGISNHLASVPSVPRPIPRPSLLNRRSAWLLLFLGAVAGALLRTGLFQRDLVNQGGWALTARFVQASLHPELSAEFLRLTLDATFATLAFAVCGTFLAVIFGFAGGLLASEVWWASFFPGRTYRGRLRAITFRAPWLVVRAILAVLRAIHEILWGLFFVNVIGLDPLTAILAIAIPFGAVIAKVFSEILDETPNEPLTALLNSGVTPHKAFAYTLLPQAFPDLLSYGFYRFECAIRAASVLGIIGAGGLGYQIFLSLQTLKYEQIWTLFGALFLLNGLADFWSGLLRRRLGAGLRCSGGACLAPNGGTGNAHRLGFYQGDRVVRASLVLGALLVAFSFWYVQPDLGQLFSARTVGHLGDVAQRAFPPDFGTLPLGEWIRLSAITLSMSLLAVAGAALLGIALSFPAANNFLLPGGVLDAGGSSRVRRAFGLAMLLLTRGVLLVSRSVPPPIWALILLFILFPGILPGAAALGLYTLGVLGRLMAEVIENLDERPLLALRAQGASGGQVFAYGVLPPTVPRAVGYLLYRWEETIRATVVVGLVGAGGLGRLLTEQLSSFDYQGVLTTLIVFVGLTFVVDQISASARRSFRAA